MEINEIIWIVSEISVILEESLGSVQEDLYIWYKSGGEIILYSEKKEIELLNCIDLDIKTYYALTGLCKNKDIKLSEY